ncbi:hypothetical protein [Bradyrhizobium sp.]|uniref:hypothetical protein n=1 Tax=Bradyrhizobium sp. TaxID=376 RepID=UPI003BAEF01A
MSEAGKVETERPQNGGNPASGPVSVKRERVTIELAVTIIGLPARTVQGMSQRGEIPGAAKFGRRWTYNEDKLYAYVRNKERESWQKRNRKSRAAIGKTASFISGSRLTASDSEARYTRAIQSAQSSSAKRRKKS